MGIPEKTRIFNNKILGVDLPVREAEDGTFLFRAANTADALSYPNLSQMISGVPAGQNVGILEYVRSGNGTNAEREVTYLAEGAFYRIVGQRQAARIKDPEIRARVEAFQSWVFNDVLVTLRRDGVKVNEFSTKTDDQIRAEVERQLEIRNYRDIIRETIKSMCGNEALYAEIRNLFLKAVCGMTAEELINSGRPIRTWKGKNGPTKNDYRVGTNYLEPHELRNFNDLIDYSAIEIRRNRPSTRRELLDICSRAYQRWMMFK